MSLSSYHNPLPKKSGEVSNSIAIDIKETCLKDSKLGKTRVKYRYKEAPYR